MYTDNHNGEEHKTQIVSDCMYKHNGHYLKFCIPQHSIALTIQKVCSFDFLQVPRGRCGKNTIYDSKAIVKLSKRTFVFVL